MISMEFGPGAIVGVGLVVIGIFSYALAKREPNVSRGVISNILVLILLSFSTYLYFKDRKLELVSG